MTNILLTICARGGSKGIPQKNIKLINGLPLIGYTIKTGRAFAQVYEADISLSTDSPVIKDVAAQFGLFTDYKRPAEFATDVSGKLEAITDLLLFEEKKRNKKYDYVLDMDVTSPLRNFNDLKQAFEILKGKPDALNIFSVSLAKRNPYFNMVEMSDGGYIQLVKSLGEIKSRQSAPQVFDMNASFYIYRRFFFNEGWKTAITPRSLAYNVEHICFDIDEPVDFKIMEVMLREKLLDFEL